jgi:hypothetical protein
MTDVSKVQGPSGPPEGSGKKEKSSADADKFKEEMHKRVTEVGKVDPDEQKKRKQREESDDEDAAAPQAGPTTPADQVTPFSLEKEGKKTSPLDMQKQGPSASPLRAAQPAPGQPKVRSSFYQAPSTAAPNDSAESFKTPPMAPQPSQPQQSPWRPEGQKPVAAGPPQSQQQEQPPEQRNAQPQEQKKGVTGMPQKIAPPSEGHTADALKDAQGSKQQDSVFFEQMGRDKEGQKGGAEEKKSEEIEESSGISGAAPPPASFSQIEDEKKQEKDKVAASDEIALPAGAVDAQAVPTAAPGPETLPPYAHLSPQIQEMFDRMVGVMTVMSQSGMTETTITLNSPQFASSVFFGTQIIIQEFSTAPQAFNIQINGTPQAVGLIQSNANDLMAAFQAGNYGFRVNRLETGYLGSRPLIKRKEKAEGDKQDQPGEGS